MCRTSKFIESAEEAAAALDPVRARPLGEPAVPAWLVCEVGARRRVRQAPADADHRHREIGFRSAADRAAFADELTAAVLDLAAHYHHDDRRACR